MDLTQTQLNTSRFQKAQVKLRVTNTGSAKKPLNIAGLGANLRPPQSQHPSIQYHDTNSHHLSDGFVFPSAFLVLFVSVFLDPSDDQGTRDLATGSCVSHTRPAQKAVPQHTRPAGS